MLVPPNDQFVRYNIKDTILQNKINRKNCFGMKRIPLTVIKIKFKRILSRILRKPIITVKQK